MERRSTLTSQQWRESFSGDVSGGPLPDVIT